MGLEDEYPQEPSLEGKVRILWADRQWRRWFWALLRGTGRWLAGAVGFALAALGLYTALRALLVP